MLTLELHVVFPFLSSPSSSSSSSLSASMYPSTTAVQNERDRISCRRPSYEDSPNGSGVSIQSLLMAEMYYREVSHTVVLYKASSVFLIRAAKHTQTSHSFIRHKLTFEFSCLILSCTPLPLSLSLSDVLSPFDGCQPTMKLP